VAIDCDEASLWSAAGRLPVAQSSPIEVLLYLAAAPLLEQGSLEEWVGVNPEVLLGEVWAPRARDSQNRESGQTWLGKNLGRLEAEIARVAGGLKTEVVVRREGGLRLNPDIVVSDVEAFMAAVERARGARGAEQITAAEQAFALRVPGLLSRVPSKWSTVGPKVEFYRWLAEAHWERAGRRLEALGRDAAMLLGRAYRDARRHEEALALYRQLLGDGPVDRRVHEGLLAAAAGTGDVVQLHQAWQQVCVCLGGDGDSDVRAFYEGLRREMERAGSRTGAGASR
jgi:hypothetical protein